MNNAYKLIDYELNCIVITFIAKKIKMYGKFF